LFCSQVPTQGRASAGQLRQFDHVKAAGGSTVFTVDQR